MYKIISYNMTQIPLLSILIPTYNRYKILDITLSRLLKVTDGFDVEIVICDNNSFDKTFETVDKYIKSHYNIKYFKQNENVGHDRNFAKAYQLSSAKYILNLGDSHEIINKEFTKVYSLLIDNKYDALVLNDGRVNNFPNKEYLSPSNLLYDLGWHMTQMSSFIISRAFLDGCNFERFFDTFFIHVGVFFEGAARIKNIKVLWISEKTIISIPQDYKNGIIKHGSWRPDLFKICMENWFVIIMSLPNNISTEAKLKCIKDHSRNSHIFDIRVLFSNRLHNIINKKDFEDNHQFIKLVTDTPFWMIKLLFNIPNIFFRLGLKIRNFFRRNI